MKFTILTIFPEFFENSLNFSLLKKASEKKIIQFEILNLRNWAKPRTVHQMVDDRPYGGGPGMVMMVEPIYRAITELKQNDPLAKTVIFSPKGRIYNQIEAEKLSIANENLILVVPHYEGFDERVLEFIDYEYCTGDYILTGGEIPTLIVIDSVARLLPGVLGNSESAISESFSQLKDGLRNIEHPHYTRPEVFTDDNGKKYTVPDVLLSGDHARIQKWRDDAQKES